MRIMLPENPREISKTPLGTGAHSSMNLRTSFSGLLVELYAGAFASGMLI